MLERDSVLSEPSGIHQTANGGHRYRKYANLLDGIPCCLRASVGYLTEIFCSRMYLDSIMEGSLFIERLKKARVADPEYALSFIPYVRVEQEAEPLKFPEERSLGKFLIFSLKLESELVATAFSALRETGSAELEFVTISDEDLRLYNLI